MTVAKHLKVILVYVRVFFLDFYNNISFISYSDIHAFCWAAGFRRYYTHVKDRKCDIFFKVALTCKYHELNMY